MCKAWYALSSLYHICFLVFKSKKKRERASDFAGIFLDLQGLKNFSKAARDLLQRIQKIDSDNYPEVTMMFLMVSTQFCITINSKTSIESVLCLWII